MCSDASVRQEAQRFVTVQPVVTEAHDQLVLYRTISFLGAAIDGDRIGRDLTIGDSVGPSVPILYFVRLFAYSRRIGGVMRIGTGHCHCTSGRPGQVSHNDVVLGLATV